MCALEHTLRLYTENRIDEIPVWRYVSASLESIKSKAESMALATGNCACVRQGLSEIGGGSLPGSTLPTWLVGISSTSPEDVLMRLRRSEPALIGRLEEGAVWLDPRTADDDEMPDILRVLRSLELG
jgi:L-seryl-tRNA(Ser) seleniumtransferase